MRVIEAIICATFFGVWVPAQTSRPTFEAASIKPSSDRTSSDFEALPGGRLIARNRSVTNLIFLAYRLRPYQIPDDPPGLSSHYDIEAKADGNPSYNEMMVMLQSLLEDRFNLKVHWDTTEQPVFVITAAKGGIKCCRSRKSEQI